MLDRIIFYSYGLLFFLVPLFWTPANFELFEYNKMMLTYGLTIIITGTWILKSLQDKRLIFNRTPLDIPLVLFLIANIISTILSIDRHTSIWGYYSRSNGGLLSTISYLLLYWGFVSNITQTQVLKLLKVGLAAGVVTSLWAISEHFGVSPSCVILRQEFNDGCWVQDVRARVFATLGQPNWLAAYLEMLIFPCIYFIQTSHSKSQTIRYTLTAITLYLAFTFTFSRGATLGLIAGLAIFFGIIFWQNKNLVLDKKKGFDLTKIWPVIRLSKITWVILAFLVINLIFGSALSRFQFTNLFTKSPSEINIQSPAGTTQLESGGTESGKIRLIVWQGALNIFRHYPFFGSGIETFAYSYYQFRPASHNLVSEWDFLYNKAHNEFLNYLATTGIIGFISYMTIILVFLIFSIRYLIYSKGQKSQDTKDKVLYTALLASYISYLVQNFFSFSVVIIAIFFYLFPGLSFVLSDQIKAAKLPKPASILASLFFRKSIYARVFQIFFIFISCYLLLNLGRLWLADTYFAKGEAYSDSDNAGQAYNNLATAAALNPQEPYYRSELGFSAAAAALAIKDDDSTTSGELKNQAIQETNQVLTTDPKNTSFWRTAIRTYFELSGLDKNYTQKTLDTIDHTISLAPTDPKLYYNKAIILGQDNRNKEAIEVLQKAIALKPDYRDAYYGLALFQFDDGQKEQAVQNLNLVLKLNPQDSEALDKLNESGKQGIATKSGTSN